MINAIKLALVLLTLWLIASVVIVKLGDRLVERDRLTSAEKLYQIGKKINPFLDTEKRMLAVDILVKERTVPDEENGLPIKDQASSDQSMVLGANVTVPVLMYHYIRINPYKDDKVGFGLSVTPADFATQMSYLAAHNYHPISLAELGNAILGGGKLPAKPIVITFDDGYKDAFTNAFPVLVKYNFKATAFVITGLVGGPNYLSWSQIGQMKASGLFTIASHTVHHYALTSVSASVLVKELVDSKRKLETMLGEGSDWFSYPYGNVDSRVAEAVKKAGYIGAFGTNSGTFESSSQMYTLPRVRVSGGRGLAFFAKSLPWQ